MTPQRWREVSRVFAAVRQCDPAEQSAYLEQACAGDPSLRAEVESLLEALPHEGEPLSPSHVGQTIGPYLVQEAIGAGGTSRVYRARDTRLGRDVALKILPLLSSFDEESLARFRREAQLLASLNHPNIAQIHGIEEAGDVHALVLEFVEGQTLADRLARGPMPLGEALSVARQLTSALEAAHAKGIVHRDLKPSNISLRPDGTIKVLDFGLAKGLVPGTGEGDPVTAGAQALTAPNTILGTAPYMAPEQVRGKDADTRSDVWAWGVVVYEMVTGRSPFGSATLADTIAAILHKEPEWGDVPEPFRQLLGLCLRKDAADRLQNIADARVLLTDVPQRAPRAHQKRVWLAAVAGAVLLVAATAMLVYWPEPGPSTPALVRFTVDPPPGWSFGTYAVISPDGGHVAFQAYDKQGRRTLAVHSFASGQSLPLSRAGEIDGASIFWSADSRSVGFVGTDGWLKRIDITGGAPRAICSLPGNWGGAAWTRDDVIVFGQRDGPLMRVAAAGGTPTPVTDLRPNEIGHGGPRFLPDHRHFVYSRSADEHSSGIYVGSLDVAAGAQSLEPVLLTSSRGVFAPSEDSTRGHLLLVSDDALLAYPFDTRRLRIDGEPVPIADGVGVSEVGPISISLVSASSTGALVYRPLGPRPGQASMTLVDRRGVETPFPWDTPPDRPDHVRMSPDGRRIAAIFNGDLWVLSTEDRPPIRLTVSRIVRFPLWTPDGESLLFTDALAGGLVRRVPADQLAAPQPASPTGHFLPFGWGPDGRVVATHVVRSSDTNIVRFRPEAGAALDPLAASPAVEGDGGVAVSPDGRWLAYTSNLTGRNEVWVQRLDTAGKPVRISSSGGGLPVWARNGRELFFVVDGAILATTVSGETSVDFTPPQRLLNLAPSLIASYDVTHDDRFVITTVTPAAADSTPIQVMLNWQRLLGR